MVETVDFSNVDEFTRKAALATDALRANIKEILGEGWKDNALQSFLDDMSTALSRIYDAKKMVFDAVGIINREVNSFKSQEQSANIRLKCVQEEISNAGKRVIFLDIDGVLNRICTNDGNNYFDPDCVDQLRRIVQETGAKVVLSTSWREFADWKNMLIQFFHAIRIEVIDCTTVTENGKRAEEIKDWIRNNQDKVNNYVVLDDDDMTNDFPDHMVRTCVEGRVGLDYEWAGKAIDILKYNSPNTEYNNRLVVQ